MENFKSILISAITIAILLFSYGFLYDQEISIIKIAFTFIGIWILLNVLFGYFSNTQNNLLTKYKRSINKGMIISTLFMMFHLFAINTGPIGIIIIVVIAGVVVVSNMVKSF